jgi:hypothetical protein
MPFLLTDHSQSDTRFSSRQHPTKVGGRKNCGYKAITRQNNKSTHNNHAAKTLAEHALYTPQGGT